MDRGGSYSGRRLEEEEILARYSEWRSGSPPSDAAGFLYKKAGGFTDRSWSRRMFRLNGSTLTYGEKKDAHLDASAEDDAESGPVVWTGDLLHAKVIALQTVFVLPHDHFSGPRAASAQRLQRCC